VLVEGHEQHHVPIGWAWHGLAGRDDPLVRGGSWPASTRRRSYSRETLERVQFDISAAKSWTGFRHKQQRRCGREKNSEHEGRVREKEEAEGKAKSQTHARRAALKGTGLTPHLRCWARPVSRTPTHSRARPGEVTAHFCNTSVSVEYGRVESTHSHDGSVMSVTSTGTLAPITAPTSP
jgi:hypothetical protein